LFGRCCFSLETLYKTRGDDGGFAAAELIDIRSAKPISTGGQEVFERASPRLSPQLFCRDVLSL
jgi:hypothetical protein